jgi:SpoVK/Ycf46/Vps4 family AAA+-type ATPase
VQEQRSSNTQNGSDGNGIGYCILLIICGIFIPGVFGIICIVIGVVLVILGIYLSLSDYKDKPDTPYEPYQKTQYITEQNNQNTLTFIKNREAIARKREKTPVNMDKFLKELNTLIGLQQVKDEVTSLISTVKINILRKKRGLKQSPLSLHLVFSGNPGTGKTTVARILGKIYCDLGILSKGHLIETDRAGLVAGYVGQTAIQTKEIIEKAKGGILFIDEAYSLTPQNAGFDFGQEAVDTLLKAMEDNRDDFIVIAAGYPDLMKNFIGSNPGLQSRFNTFINFEDYNPNELLEIFLSLCRQHNYFVDAIANVELQTLLIKDFIYC